MDTEKIKMVDAALDRIMGDLDDIEGHGAMAHSTDECPDPLTCREHDSEMGKELTPDGGVPAAVKIEIHKMGLPSLDGAKEGDAAKAEESLSDEEAEELKKLLK